MTDWRDLQPDWGIVLGSGLGRFVDCIEVLASVPYSEIEGLPKSKVPGHAGRFVFGKLAEKIVLVAAGRVHLYEGWSAADVAAHVRWMHGRGLRRIVLTNAAGTLNPQHPPGRWMLLTDHINLTAASPLIGSPNFIDQSEVYSRRLRDLFTKQAAELNVPLHQGVYAATLGPQYETPAEIRMLKIMGADAVGMSTVHEAIQACALGMEVAAFSCLTNWAAGISPTPLSHQEVIEVGQRAAGTLLELLERTDLD
jgi:purine-nucleoside phosphorylase